MQKRDQQREYAKNKAREAEHARAYYQLHKDECKARNDAWRKQHPERWRELADKATRAWLERDPEAKKRRDERHREWRRQHADAVMAYKAKRKALKLNNGGSYTVEEWEQLKMFYNRTCLCYDRREPEIRLTADHVLPLTRGGTSYIVNIQPLCNDCNASKHAKHIDYRIGREADGR